MGMEKIGGKIEMGNEISAERIEKTKDEIRSALVMLSCTDMDGFVACMSQWLDKNEEMFEAAFDRLLGIRPKFIEEWESADPKKRDEIMDIINDPIVGKDIHMSVAGSEDDLDIAA